MIKQLVAFHGDSKIKNEYLNRVKNHRVADEIIKGKYWENGKGCAVGCTIHGSDHSRYETELGIPQIIARLEDCMFEGMNLADAKEWPERFLKSIPVNANLSLVWPKFVVWLLIDKEHGIIKFAKKEKTITTIKKVADLFKKVINGKVVSKEKFKNAAAAAAAAYAAAAASYAADADAAAAAAAAAYAAAAASYAANADAAAAAAATCRQNHYKLQSDKLCELLSNAPTS